ncbi:MAG: glycosyl hydrolase family 28-related protein [Mixta calida]|nr:glycosyl hydrolase family 28-related protein [Mixta calida]
MATQPTQNPVPSESPRDLKFNAGKIDEFVTSLALKYQDRFGTEHYTIEGLRQLAQEAIAAFGWITVDSFQDGATLTLPNQVLRDESTVEYYRWDGAFPKEVPADSTPADTGGVGSGAWISVGDAALRQMLNSKFGYSAIGEFDSIDDLRSAKTSSLMDGSRVSVRSYHKGLGYGGGFFRWNASSTDDDDGGYIINPTGNAGPGRWKREYSSPYTDRTVNIVEFGAKVNDESFDSYNAIQNSIWHLNPYKSNEDKSRIGGDVLFPPGVFYISDTILGSPNVSLRGTSKVGFSNSSNGGTRLRPLSSMDPIKVMFDTAPYMQDGLTRYTKTNEKIYGIEMQGYYGQQIDGIVFDGRGTTQACVRIMRCPTFKIRNCSFINTKVGIWINASWGGVIEDCHTKDTRYANILLWYANGVDIRGGYYGMYRTAVASVAEQWFHRPIAPENTPNIAYSSSSIYAYNSLDIRISATFEGMNKLISAFYCRGINFFGGYIEDLNNPAEQNDHRVLVHSQASTINLRNMFINCSNMPFMFQSGNSGATLEDGTITLDTPYMNTGFTDLIRGIGYGKSRAVIISNYPTTSELAITLQALRNQSIVFVGLLDDYLYRPSNAVIGSGTFSINISNIVAGGLYEVRLQSKSTSGAQYWDITFDIYVGDNPDISSYVFRMRTGSQTAIPKPTASFSNGVLTLNFTGAINNSTVIKTVPKTDYNYSL